jgi:hypothetical protein
MVLFQNLANFLSSSSGTKVNFWSFFCRIFGSVADPGCFIPDPDPGYWILGIKKHRIPEIKIGTINKANLILASYGFRNKFY